MTAVDVVTGVGLTAASREARKPPRTVCDHSMTLYTTTQPTEHRATTDRADDLQGEALSHSIDGDYREVARPHASRRRAEGANMAGGADNPPYGMLKSQ